MPRLCSSLLLSLIAASSASALSIEFSDPYHRVWNGATQSRIGENFATYAFQDERTNTTGDLSLSTDIGYAAAFGESDVFHIRASSFADGSQLEERGLDSVSSEGNSWFEIDFLVHYDEPRVRVDLAYTVMQSFVSTAPRPTFPFGAPGTNALMGVFSLAVIDYDTNDFVFFAESSAPGQHIASGMVDAETVYRLRMLINAVSSAKETMGYASAHTGIDLMMYAVPEPGTSLLVIGGLLGLAVRRRVRL